LNIRDYSKNLGEFSDGRCKNLKFTASSLSPIVPNILYVPPRIRHISTQRYTMIRQTTLYTLHFLRKAHYMITIIAILTLIGAVFPYKGGQ